jgi:hypothetical protein
MRPKAIVYFEGIMLGAILLVALRTYLYDRDVRRIAMNPVFDLVTFEVLVLVVGARLLSVLIFPLTLTLLVSRRRSKIAMWISIALFALSFAGFVTRLLLLGTALQLGNASNLALLIVKGAVYGLLFTPSARRWMRREDEKNEKLREVFD